MILYILKSRSFIQQIASKENDVEINDELEYVAYFDI